MNFKTNYHRNKEAAIYRNEDPSMTDQSAARDTDINIIVASFLVHGQAPGTTAQAMYEDFSELPEDLRGYIERGKELDEHRMKLPKEIRDLPIEDLLALTPETLREKLTPAKPAKQAANPAEEEKK